MLMIIMPNILKCFNTEIEFVLNTFNLAYRFVVWNDLFQLTIGVWILFMQKEKYRQNVIHVYDFVGILSREKWYQNFVRFYLSLAGNVAILARSNSVLFAVTYSAVFCYHSKRVHFNPETSTYLVYMYSRYQRYRSLTVPACALSQGGVGPTILFIIIFNIWPKFQENNWILISLQYNSVMCTFKVTRNSV